MLFRVFVLTLLLSACFPANAATVSPISGEVRVSTGHGFRLIKAPMEIAAGGLVMVSSDGAASIAYSGSCIVSAPRAAVTVIQRQPQCPEFPEPSYFGFATAKEPQDFEQDPFGFAPKVDSPENDHITRKKRAARDPRLWDHDLLIVGGVVLGAGALAAILASQARDHAASP